MCMQCSEIYNLENLLHATYCYGVHYNVSLLFIQFIPAFVILFCCAISDYNQIPGYVPITNAVPNWKKDMIIKKNEEKVREYVVNNWYSFIYKLETGINDSDCVPCNCSSYCEFPEISGNYLTLNPKFVLEL